MSELLLSSLLHQALLLSVAIVLLRTLRRPLQRLGAGAVYASWLLLPLLLLTPALPRPVVEPLRVFATAAGRAADNGVPSLAAQPLPTSLAALWLSLWLAGTAFVLAVQAWRQWRLVRLGLRLPAGSSPALVGVLRPRVALPVDFDDRFTPAERELILAHEAVHRARQDNLWNLIATLLAALHWWNPLAWWAARRLRADQELACDATVLASRPGAVATYSRALLAAHGLTPHGAPLASRWVCAHPLVERMTMLQHHLPISRRRGLALATALLCLAGTAYALQAAPGEPPVVEGFTQLRFELQLTVDGKLAAKSKLVSFPAKPAVILTSDAEDKEQWIISLSASFAGEDRLMIDSEIRRNQDKASIQGWREQRKPAPETLGSVVASPRLLIKDGDLGRIRATTPDGHEIELSVKATSFRGEPSVGLKG
ncbi:M56 family metallopeptidase [Roseateles sp. NT4]|uniref:M56 family metallopeptidase n=1 Tax=Roseateles sp. NT4 TaxID=3453715 RepID=UPI003EED2C3E